MSCTHPLYLIQRILLCMSSYLMLPRIPSIYDVSHTLILVILLIQLDVIFRMRHALIERTLLIQRILLAS